MSETTSRQTTWGRRLRWFVFYPLVVLCFVSIATTGVPIPFWHLETLDHPVKVRSVTRNHLLLEDGRTVPLLNIQELPVDDRLFQAALSDGVEVDPSGDVFGLLWVDRNCGLDAVVWRRHRVNLSHLAGAINPLGIDDVVPIDAREFLQETCIDTQARQNDEDLHLNAIDLIQIHRIGEQIQYSIQQAQNPEIPK